MQKVMCPFCGQEMKIHASASSVKEWKYVGQCMCLDCGASGPVVRGLSSVKSAAGEAVYAMKRRAPLVDPTNAAMLGDSLVRFDELEYETRELVAEYIECPSSPDCTYDGKDESPCVECKVKWLGEKWRA